MNIFIVILTIAMVDLSHTYYQNLISTDFYKSANESKTVYKITTKGERNHDILPIIITMHDDGNVYEAIYEQCNEKFGYVVADHIISIKFNRDKYTEEFTINRLITRLVDGFISKEYTHKCN